MLVARASRLPGLGDTHITHIEDFAFVGCSSLYATPPASVQSYGPGAFIDCRMVSVPTEGLAAFEASL